MRPDVGTLDKAILLSFAGINVMPIHIVIASPFQDFTTGELCAVITDDAGKLSIDTHVCCQSLLPERRTEAVMPLKSDRKNQPHVTWPSANGDTLSKTSFRNLKHSNA